MKRTVVILLGLLCGSVVGIASAAEKGVWLEAEGFTELGGWVIDQQSMEQMGSAYVMAHGIGIPVADAETVCTIPESGDWTVWVRTRDWTAPWKRGKPGGTFKVRIDGHFLPETLGTNGSSWGWQKAGTAAIKNGAVTIALHDLTGFNGRCDAIYLTLDANSRPENDKQRLAGFRRKITNTVCRDDPAVYDLAVVGGGISGICTAIAATRTGSKAILIQDRPVLGGNNSSEVRVGLGGNVNVPPYPRLGDVVTEIAPIAAPVVGAHVVPTGETFEDTRKRNIFDLSPRCRLALSERVIGVERAPGDSRQITAVIARNIRTGIETRYRARLFADCTGDAVVARMMGAEVMYGREARAIFNESLAPEKADNQVMGLSVLWYSTKADKPTAFPDLDWGIPFNDDTVVYVGRSLWDWETGFFRNQVEETEYIRDYGLMSVYANWSYLKNHSKRKAEWANHALTWASPIGGKRESYRVVGDYVLNQNDIEKHVVYPDATAAITWNLDFHFPDPENAKSFEEAFRACAYHRGIAKPYPVPYRCLYARDVKNLFLAGRDISTSHAAFAAVRVQRTLGMLGEVVGMAATICAKRNIYPRDVYDTRLDELKTMMTKGVPQPRTYHAYGTGVSESYHFQDIGHVPANPPDPQLKQRIDALKVQHKNK